MFSESYEALPVTIIPKQTEEAHPPYQGSSQTMEKIREESKRGNAQNVEISTSEESGIDACVSGFIFIISMLMIICTFPLSLFVCTRMVQVCYIFMYHLPIYISTVPIIIRERLHQCL